VVGIHSDATVEAYKRRPLMTADERVRVVEGCRYVDRVIPDAPLRISAEWLSLHQIDLIVHGDGLDQETMDLMYAVPSALGTVRTVPYTAGISTSEILARLRQRLELPGSWST
jgi:glycerol-3-phosphate cytidylyltransferase-like family protein